MVAGKGNTCYFFESHTCIRFTFQITKIFFLKSACQKTRASNGGGQRVNKPCQFELEQLSEKENKDMQHIPLPENDLVGKAHSRHTDAIYYKNDFAHSNFDTLQNLLLKFSGAN